MRLIGLWWWIDRWRKSTAFIDMTLEEQGAYRNLLDEACLRGGPLPNNEGVLAKACGDPRKWRRVREPVMRHFSLEADGCWHNATLDEVLKQSVRRATNQANYRSRRDNTPDNNHDSKPASPDPDPDPKEREKERARPSRIGPAIGLLKQHGHVAFDGLRVYVPWGVHHKLLALRNNPNAGIELDVWYQRVSEDWTTGAHRSDSPGADMFAFWAARYNEQWPPTKVAASTPPDPAAALAKARYKDVKW